MQRQVGLGMALVLGTAALLGCNGVSDVGNQNDAKAPIAWAKALNHPFTGSDGNISLTVRAGSEVFVNGVDSFGPSVPVLKYDWTVSQQPAGETVVLLKRNESTVSFRAPHSNFELKLTVTDSNGATDDATVTVSVTNVQDVNAFLTYGGAQTYTIAAVTNQVAPLTDDVNFDIVVERRISYTDLDGQQHSNFLVDTQTLTGKWLAAYGTGGTSADCGGGQNPRFTLPLPALNAEDVLAKVGFEHPEMAVDPALIDSANVILKVTLTPKDPLPVVEGVQTLPGVCILGPPAPTPTPAATKTASEGRSSFATAEDGVSVTKKISLDKLIGSPTSTRDTRSSAQAYYRTIDSDQAYEAKQTFSGWLKAAGFTSGATDWDTLKSNSSAHAVYLNNYDLGFGRDMYLRIGQCDDGAPPTLGGTVNRTRIGQCDVYGVVVNYTNLEAAAKKLDPLMAVAMEYARVDPTKPRITKFYMYAPDGKGDFQRVLSANLDGRGEKFVPGVCTVCHGGTPRGLDSVDKTKYANGGDLNAGFLSWDLDAFLYSDTDPYFSNSSDPFFPDSDRELAETYTRALQADELKKLNQLAYLTFANPDPSSEDPALSERFDRARDLVEGWYGGPGMPGTDFNGAYVPAGWKNGAGWPNGKGSNPEDSETIYADVFARHCRACHVLHAPKTSNQIPMGSYQEFFEAKGLGDALGAGRMPFARMTMDRLWTTDAGETLRTHLLDSDAKFEKPGTPKLCITPTTLNPDRKTYVTFDASCSTFVDSFAWTATAPDGSSVPLVGADTARSSFLAADEGEYVVAVADGSATLEPVKGTATVAKSIPVAGSTNQAISKSMPDTGPLIFDIDVFTELDGTTKCSPDPADICTIEVTGTTGVSSAVPSPDDPKKITITVSSLVSGESSVNYLLKDTDGDESNEGTIKLNVGADLEVKTDGEMNVIVNGVQSIDLQTLVTKAPAGQPIGFNVSQPSLERYRGKGSTTLPEGSSTVTYQAPKGVATKAGGITLAPGQPDTFVFEVFLKDRPTETAPATVKVNLLAQTSFADVANGMRTNCSGCHSSPQVGSALVVKATDVDSTVYCSLKTGKSVTGGPGTEPAGTDYLNLASPNGSLVYQKVRALQPHGGGNVAGFDAARLLAWIEEGGYLTSATNQDCP